MFKIFYFPQFSSDFDILRRFGNLKGSAKIFFFGNLIIMICLEMTVTLFQDDGELVFEVIHLQILHTTTNPYLKLMNLGRNDSTSFLNVVSGYICSF